MAPVIFEIEARWDPQASVWSGRSNKIPIVAEAATLEALMAKAESQALDLLPDNHPDIPLRQLQLEIAIVR